MPLTFNDAPIRSPSLADVCLILFAERMFHIVVGRRWYQAFVATNQISRCANEDCLGEGGSRPRSLGRVDKTGGICYRRGWIKNDERVQSTKKTNMVTRCVVL
jgi:hypothetical protein